MQPPISFPAGGGWQLTGSFNLYPLDGVYCTYEVVLQITRGELRSPRQIQLTPRGGFPGDPLQHRWKPPATSCQIPWRSPNQYGHLAPPYSRELHRPGSRTAFGSSRLRRRYRCNRPPRLQALDG